MSKTPQPHYYKLEAKHERVCKMLDHYDFKQMRSCVSESVSVPSASTYTKLLLELGFIKRVPFKSRFKFYLRVRDDYPTVDDVAQ